MPYEKNENLPDSVKTILPEAAQSIWRAAFNSNFEKSKDDEASSRIAWTALKNAGWSKDENGNWKKNHEELRDVEIFSAGVWHGEKYTEDDIDELVNNFNELRDKIKPILKVAHRNDMHKSDGQPALGWVTNLCRQGSKLVATFGDVPKIVFNAISKKLYKRVSSEIYQNLEYGGKKYKRALAGVGLMGADIPEVKNLQDIEIFFSDAYETKIYTSDVTNGIIINEEKNIMDEILKKQYDEKIASLEKAVSTAQAEKIAFAEGEKKKLTDEIGRLRSQILSEKGAFKIKEFKEFCEKMVLDGKMIPAARDILVTDLDKINFSEGQDISISFDKFKTFMEKTKEILDKTEKGFHLPTEERFTRKSTYAEKPGVIYEDQKLDTMAKEYAEKNKVTYAEAISKILIDNPDLLGGN